VIQKGGPVAEEEMRRTFNLGVGLVAVVAPDHADAALQAAAGTGGQAWLLGEVIERAGDAVVYA
jgi:phosphoribosylformylglycinamidine cyclo-ligase